MANATSLLKVIRKHCLDCCCGSKSAVAACSCESCNLWLYRFGKNPFAKPRQYTEEQKAAMRENLRIARAKKTGKQIDKQSMENAKSGEVIQRYHPVIENKNISTSYVENQGNTENQEVHA